MTHKKVKYKSGNLPFSIYSSSVETGYVADMDLQFTNQWMAAPTTPALRIYFGESDWSGYESADEIGSASLSPFSAGSIGTIIESGSTNCRGFFGVSADNKNRKLYWSILNNDSPDLSSILSSSLDGSEKGVVLSEDIEIYSMKVIPSENKIIYGEGNHILRTASLDGTASGQIGLFSNTYVGYGAYAFSTITNKLYIRGLISGVLYTSSLDGSGYGSLGVGDGHTSKCYGMDIDEVNQKLYWTVDDAATGRIYTSSLDGTNLGQIYASSSGGNFDIRGLAVDSYGEKVYFAGQDGNSIYSCSLDGSDHGVFFYPGFDDPSPVALDRGEYVRQHSPITASGIDLTNIHEDTYGDIKGAPLQGPFTYQYVGGNQHRHVPLNTGSDSLSNRPELFRVNFSSSGEIRVVGQDSGSTSYPRALYVRTDTAKRPLNVMNIRQETVSGSTLMTAQSLYHEDFDEMPDASTGDPGDWSNGQFGGGDTGITIESARYFTADDGDDNSSATGPTGPQSGTIYVYTEASNGYNNKYFALSRSFTPAETVGIENMSFYYHMYGAHTGWLSVSASINGADWTGLDIVKDVGGSPSVVSLIDGEQQTSEDITTTSGSWRLARSDLGSYSGQPLWIKFLAKTGPSFESDISIDNIKFQVVHPTRVRPSISTIGNYTHDYDIIQTTGRTSNNRAFAEAASGAYAPGFIGDPNLPYSGSLVTQFVSGARDFLTGTALPDFAVSGANDFVFVNRFNAPGGTDVSPRGTLDTYAEEYAPNNEINVRNNSVRSLLRSDLARHTPAPDFSTSTGSTEYHNDYRNPKLIYKQSTPLQGDATETLVSQIIKPLGIAIDPDARKMYWTQRGTFVTDSSYIYRANLDGTSAEELYEITPSPTYTSAWGIALDLKNQKMYWSDPYDGVSRANLDGTSPEIGFVVPSSGYIRHIALDPDREKIYWADGTATAYSGIHSASYDGSGKGTMILFETSSVGIALDVAAQKVYWTTWESGNVGKIQRGHVGETNREDVVTGLSIVNDISLDVSNGKVYWADSGTDKVHRANLDGSSVQDVVSSLKYPAGLALDPKLLQVYWTDLVAWGYDSISKIQRANMPESWQYDNAYVTHAVPRCSLDYAWINSSATTTKFQLPGYQNSGSS